MGLLRGARFRPSGGSVTISGGATLPDPVTVAHGGTGATTLTGTLVGNGTSAVTAGTLSVANGGTGGTTFTSGRYLKAAGTSAFTVASAPIPVADGGTGAATLTGILKGNGTSAVTAVTAPSGTIVGTSDTQALTNKDLTDATNSFPTSVATLTGAQVLTNKDLTDATNTFPSTLATSGANSNITSLTGLSTPLSVAQGGTGAATLSSGALLKGAGTSAVAAADLTGDVTTSGGLATTIAAAAVTLAKQADLAANSIIGNNTGSSATPLALTRAQVMALLSANATAAFSFNSQRVTSVADATTAGDAWTINNTKRHLSVATAVDRGLLTQNYPIEIAAGSGSALGTAGTIYVVRLWAPATTISNVVFWLTANGSSLTTSQCLVALYDASKTQVGSTSSDVSATSFVGGAGLKTVAVGTWNNATAQVCYAAFMFNGSTGPALLRATNNGSINAGLSGDTLVAATDSQTGRTTTMPGSLATLSSVNTGYWAALS